MDHVVHFWRVSREGTVLEPVVGLIPTLGTWAKDVRGRLAARTLEGYRYVLGLLPASGILFLHDLTRAKVRQHLTERRERDGISPVTQNKILAAILSFASWCEDHGLIKLEQYHELRRLRVKVRRGPPPRFLTREEYARLLAAARSHRETLGLAVAIAVHTGLRAGELRALHHEDLVLDVGEPFVRVLRDRHETKTQIARTPAIAMGFAAELVRLGVGPPKTGPIFPAGGERAGGRPSKSAYVGLKAIESWMDHARSAAGLGDEITFITLRHTYASWLVQGGCPLGKVSTWLGHKDVAVTWRHYCGFAPGGDKDVEKGFKTPPPAKPAPKPPTPATGMFTSC